MLFDMVYGGGGFVISVFLVRVLVRVLDFCLMWYGYLYGSDLRIFFCIFELGVGLIIEFGFY